MFIIMTIQEASTKLIDWYSEKDVFNFNKDILKLLKIIDDDDDKVIVYAALKCLVAEGFLVCEKNYEGQEIFILVKKLFFNEQEVKINGVVALEICSRINWFSENIAKSGFDISNPLSLNQQDLVNLIEMYDFFKKRFEERPESD